MEIEKSEYREILFEDVYHVNRIASESPMRSILTFRQQDTFGGGMVLLRKGERVKSTADDRLVQLKKHYERLTMTIDHDFLLFGFSILLLPSSEKNNNNEVRVTSHVDMQAVVVRLKPRTTSSFFSASDLEYLVLDRLTLCPLKNCIVLEHPLWKPHSSGRLHSPVGSLLSWWRQQQKERERADMVAETLSRVNIFYEDMPELYQLTEDIHTDESSEMNTVFAPHRHGRAAKHSKSKSAGEFDGTQTRVLFEKNKLGKSSTPGIISYLGHLEKGEKTALHVLHQREAIYGGLLDEHMAPVQKQILHDHTIPVNTYRAPRGTRIQRIQMPCDVKVQSRSSSSSGSARVERGDIMNSAFLDIKQKIEQAFSDQAMRSLEVGRGELGSWVFTGNKAFGQRVLQDAIASVMKGDVSAWQDVEKEMRRERKRESEAREGAARRAISREETEDESGELLVSEGEEEEKEDLTEEGTEEDAEKVVAGDLNEEPSINEKQAEEIERTVKELSGISTVTWSLIFYEFLTATQEAVTRDVYFRDETQKRGPVFSGGLGEERQKIHQNLRPEGKLGSTKPHRKDGPSSGTTIDPEDPNYVIVGPYRRRIK